jgi:hypothetical protein
MILRRYSMPSSDVRCGRIGNMGMKRFLRWPRFRYSLRTFFVALTVFGIWLGWQVNIVRERRELLRQLKETQSYALGEQDAGNWVNSAGNGLDEVERQGARRTAAQMHPVQISFVREWLGDQGVYHINLSESLEQSWERFESAFPEAVVIITPTSKTATPTLIKYLHEKFDRNDGFMLFPEVRAVAIDIIAERKAREAIPYLIRCLSDRRTLYEGTNNFVGGHADKALSEISGREFGFDQNEWWQWWKEQTRDASSP